MFAFKRVCVCSTILNIVADAIFSVTKIHASRGETTGAKFLPFVTELCSSNTVLPSCAQTCNLLHGEFTGAACAPHGPYIPDVLFWSVILFFTTFFLCSFLKQFKTERYFPTRVTQRFVSFCCQMFFEGWWAWWAITSRFKIVMWLKLSLGHGDIPSGSVHLDVCWLDLVYQMVRSTG